MTSLYENAILDLIQQEDEKELIEILEILKEAAEEGDTCEVFFLDEYPHIEGWLHFLRENGCSTTYQQEIPSWLVSW